MNRLLHNRTDAERSRRRTSHVAWILWGQLCLLGMTGCQIPLKTPSFSKINNPFVRQDPTELARKAAQDPERGMDELEKAVETFDAGKYYEAEKEFKRIAKKHKNYLVEEDALYYKAECQYKLKRYANAQDSYNELVKKFPSTRYIDTSSGRLFNIAGYWLGNNDLAQSKKMTQVGHDDIRRESHDENPWKFPLTPNLTDRTRPLFDTNGRALQALKSVWMNDPTGPLADDALMMTAGYQILVGNYREADHHLGILREEYPKSEYARKAYLLGPHVKLMTYQGALYDTKPLDDARNILQASMSLYPDEDHQEQFMNELSQVRELTAEEGARMAEYWRRKGKPVAAAIYSELVLKNYSDTESAGQAKQILSRIDEKHRQGILDAYPEPDEKIQQAGHRLLPPLYRPRRKAEQTAENTDETEESEERPVRTAEGKSRTRSPANAPDRETEKSEPGPDNQD